MSIHEPCHGWKLRYMNDRHDFCRDMIFVASSSYRRVGFGLFDIEIQYLRTGILDMS